MISFLKNLNIYKLKAKSYKLNRGMTYVELIVVLSIFATLSSVVLFNYKDFQARVDIKNLASDIALQVVQAQNSSLSGLLPQTGAPSSTWKPAYGVYFDISPITQKQFIYFVDLDNANGYGTGETLNTISITKNNYISNINKCSANPCDSGSSLINSLSITFKRPDSRANFLTTPVYTFTGSEYVQITIKSPSGATALIKLYPSGRVQVN